MDPAEISKKINKKIPLFGLYPEEWSWAFAQSFKFLAITAVFGLVLANIGKLTPIPTERIGNDIIDYGLLLFIPSIYASIKMLRLVSRNFGTNTAFLVLSQHSTFALLFSKSTGQKNTKFKPNPNNHFQNIE